MCSCDQRMWQPLLRCSSDYKGEDRNSRACTGPRRPCREVAGPAGASAGSGPGLRLVTTGIHTVMPIVRFPRLTPRGVLSFVMGIAAIFDLTGATVYRTMREVLPPAPSHTKCP